MKAFVIPRFGGFDVFEETEMPTPVPGPGQVLIQVEASSVNPVDYGIRSGALAMIAPPFPAILHGDVAGTVAAVGEGVTAVRPGDAVYACAGGLAGSSGALADFMLADSALVARRPVNLSPAEAGVLPLVAITAWEALVERARVLPGERVLIYGGTGGVGHVAVQVAKYLGATVYTTVSSPDKAVWARKLGADVVIPYREQSVEEYVAEHTGGAGFDVVLDTVGGANLPRALSAARLYGRVVTLNALSSQDLTTAHLKGLSLHVVFMLIPLLHGVRRASHGEILSAITALVEQGAVRPLLDPRTFSFAEAGEAHRYAEEGQHLGKISLVQ